MREMTTSDFRPPALQYQNNQDSGSFEPNDVSRMPSFFRRILTAFQSPQARRQLPPPDGLPVSVQVSFNADGVTQTIDEQAAQTLAWTDIEFITIHIEDDLLPFPFWYVGNQDIQLRIPNDAEGAEPLFFDGFTRYLTGYKSDRTFRTITEASIALEGSFLVWETQPAQGV